MFILQVVGLPTNIGFLYDLAKHPQFEKGHVHTGFIAEHGEELFPLQELSQSRLCQAVLALLLTEQQQTQLSSALSKGNVSMGNWLQAELLHSIIK